MIKFYLRKFERKKDILIVSKYWWNEKMKKWIDRIPDEFLIELNCSKFIVLIRRLWFQAHKLRINLTNFIFPSLLLCLLILLFYQHFIARFYIFVCKFIYVNCSSSIYLIQNHISTRSGFNEIHITVALFFPEHSASFWRCSNIHSYANESVIP